MSKIKYTDKPVLKSFNCPSCGATLNITAVGVTVDVVCKSCHVVIDVNHPTLKYIKSYQAKRTYQPDIPIGSRGTFAGHVYECIGWMRKRDGSYFWREYLLYNPYVGFKWLIEVDGHWSVAKKVYLDIENSLHSAFTYSGNRYRIFNDSSAEVDYVEGEFYWRIRHGDKTSVKDYIAPPYMLSYESTSDEKSWTQSRYVESERIKEIFNLKSLPSPEGIGAIQPTVVKEKFRSVLMTMLITWVVIFAVHLIRVANAKKEVVFQSTFYSAETQGKGEEIKTNVFEIDSDKKNLKVELSTDLNNNWLFLDALLVDVQTGKGIPINIEAQYYSGYSGGESWYEGSKRQKEIFFNIPKGQYFISIVPQSQSGKGGVKFTLSLISDVILNRNWIIALILTFIHPLILLFKQNSIERQRWSNSDFSPYEVE